jgi:hypothetical protein
MIEDRVTGQKLSSQLADKAKYIEINEFVLKFKYGIKMDGSDESVKLQNVINDAVSGSTIYLPVGTLVVGNINISKPVYFKGYAAPGIDSIGTTIQLAPNATYLFKYTGTSNFVINGGGFERIRFNGNAQTASYLIRAEWTSHFFIEYCGFNNVQGSAISLQRVQESGVFKCNFRKCGSDISDVIYLDSYVTAVGNNVNNLHIEMCTFGLNSGNWIGAATDANLDVIWINRNKFEYDSTPTWVNSGAKAVIRLGEVSRCSITDNNFFNFSDVNNHYSKLIELVNNNGVVTVMDNKFDSCTADWLVTSTPRVVAKNNEAKVSTLTINCTSTLAQDIDEPIQRNSDGSLKVIASTWINNFISSHQTGGVQKRTFVTDTESLAYCKTVKSINTQFNELCRLNVGGYYGFYNTNLVLKVRTKATTADSSLGCYLDSTLISANTITTASGWTWTTFTIPVASITKNSVLKLTLQGTSPLLFDGYITS